MLLVASPLLLVKRLPAMRETWVRFLGWEDPLEKEIVYQVQEAQRVPYRINPSRNMPRHILIKLIKTKHKERTLKAAREKQQVTYKENSIRLTADISAETLQARREWQDIFRVLKGKIYNQDYYTQQGSHSELMEK